MADNEARRYGQQVDPRVVEGIGRIAVTWPECELMLIDVLARLASFDLWNARLVFVDSPPNLVLDAVRLLLKGRDNPDAAVIRNYIDYFDACRQKRNRYVHSYLLSDGNIGTRGRRTLDLAPLPTELPSIYQAVDDIEGLWSFSLEILRYLNGLHNGEDATAPPERTIPRVPGRSDK